MGGVMGDELNSGRQQISRTTVVLTNWKRPRNLRRIAERFRNQTRPPAALVVVDNQPGGYDLPPSVKADDVISFGLNAGPPCRWAGATFAKTEFVLFFDDDMLPGHELIAAAETQADELGGKFSTISDVGRLYRSTRRGPKSSDVEWKVRVRNVGRSVEPTPVDMTCRAHLVRTEFVSVAVRDRVRASLDGCSVEMLRNDDIFMSQGIQLETGWPSYLSRDMGREGRFRCRNLPAPHSLSGQPNHHECRNELVNWYANLGWRSLRHDV